MKRREAMVLIFNSTVSREFSGTNFTPTRAITYTYTLTNTSAWYAYVMWAELDHCHFLYVPAISNVVITGNGTGTKCFYMEPCACV